MFKLKRFFRYRQHKPIKHGVCISHDVELINTEYGIYTNFAHHASIKDSIIGDRTSIGRYTKIQFADIGKYCSISWDVTIGAISHPMHSISTHAFSFRKQFGLCNKDSFLTHQRITIGNDVWIGCGVIIMPGITIGDGAIIGAGAVVTKDVKPYEIVAGCPAKHLQYRFDDHLIKELLDLQWWNLPDQLIIENIHYFSPYNNIQENPNLLKEFLSLTKNKYNHEKNKTLSDCRNGCELL